MLRVDLLRRLTSSLNLLRVYLLISLISVAIALALFEVYAHINNDKFYSYGWQVDNITKEKIESCRANSSAKKVVAVFGSSMVEFYGEAKQNLVTQLNKKSSNNEYFCNFGVSGAGIPVFISRFKRAIKENLRMDAAVFYFSEGNGFMDFIDHSPKPANRYDDTTDRKLSALNRLIKSTYAINIIYRNVLKPLFFRTHYSDERVVRDIFSRSYYKEVTLEDAIERVKNTPKEQLDKFESDLLNKSWYEVALMSPNYFRRIHHPDRDEFIKQKEIVFGDIEVIKSLCQENKIRCNIVIIPQDFFLFEETKNDWINTFRFNPYSGQGPSDIANSIVANYTFSYYPAGLFQIADFIRYDGHLTESGSEKLADYTYKLISK